MPDRTCRNGHAADRGEVGEGPEIGAVAGVGRQRGRQGGAGRRPGPLAAARDAGVVEAAGVAAGRRDGPLERREHGRQVTGEQGPREAAAQREQDDLLVAVDLPADRQPDRGEGRGVAGRAGHGPQFVRRPAIVAAGGSRRARLLRYALARMTLPERPRVVVTGAGGGLGRALCLELARRRGRVVAADIDLPAAEITAAAVRDAGGEAVAVACDVAQAAQVEALAVQAQASFGGTDLVINNAGVAVAGQMADIPLADWEWIVGINLWGVVHGCRSFIPRFKAQGRGAILNVASAAGLINSPEMGPYNVTKAAVVSLSETLCTELKPAKIGVTVLCPTFFQTNIMQATRTQNPGQRNVAEKLMARAKIQAPEVARAALAGVDAGQLYVLPHADGAWAWRVKRLAPERFYQVLVPRYFRKVIGGK